MNYNFPIGEEKIARSNIELKCIKRISEYNEVLPNLYTVINNGEVIISDEDFVYVLQCFINRIN